MAHKTIARPRAPASPGCNTANTANTPDPHDLLENKLAQLTSLTWVCYGGGVDWLDGKGPQHLDNVLWALGQMAQEAEDLFQRCERVRNAASEMRR